MKILRGLKEYYHCGRSEGKQKSPSEYARDLKKFCDEIEEEYKRVVVNCEGYREKREEVLKNV